MKYNISILISANNDLLEIYGALSEFGHNPPDIFAESFYKFLDNVSDMPYMFQKYIRKPKYRKATLAYNYLVFYQVTKKEKTVKVYRILCGKQDIGSLL